MAFGQIPQATEQGIFRGLTGNFSQRTGISRAERGARGKEKLTFPKP
jgi:hypothetical protein